MGTEEVVKNIFRIAIPLPGNPLKELNSYLIRDPKRSLLIDAGFRMEACREVLLTGLAELGVGAEDFDVFLTHLHSDHSGLAAEAAGAQGRIFISGIDREGLEDAGPRWKRIMARFTEGGMPKDVQADAVDSNPGVRYAMPPGSHPFVSLRDGDVLPVGGYTFRCILTPGHTPGHMCLWDEESGVMITGDHVLFDITPNITAWPTLDDALGDYLNSLAAVRAYPVKLALPGHRKTGDFHARVDELTAHHHERLAEAEAVVRANPGLTPYEIAGRMRWRIRADNWETFPSAQKIFAIGECLSHLDYLERRGRVRRERDGEWVRYWP